MTYLKIATQIISLLHLLPPRLRVAIFEAFPAETVTASERVVSRRW